jgi:hypothetical protein
MDVSADLAVEPSRNSPSPIRELVDHMPDSHAELRDA